MHIIGDAGLPGGVPTTLDNVNDTITGAGRIGDDGLTLKNSGSIDADGNTPLVIDTGGRTVTNTGTLEAFDDSTLYIDSPLNNTGGKLLANTAATCRGTRRHRRHRHRVRRRHH